MNRERPATPTEASSVFDLVRHCHAPWQPTEARALSAAGRRDALRVARILCRRSDRTEAPISAIISGPSLRARQTVEPLARSLGLPIIADDNLRERHLGEPLRDETAFRAAVHATWQDPTFCLPGGETNAAAQSRGVSVLARLRRDHPGGHIVVATHGNLLALMLQHFDASINFDFWSALAMPDIYRLRWSAADETDTERLWSPEDDPL